MNDLQQFINSLLTQLRYDSLSKESTLLIERIIRKLKDIVENN